MSRSALKQQLVLGTAQLGMDYGINNAKGQPLQADATEILGVAYQHGIDTFDTAQAYGKSEAVLGEAFKELGIAQNIHVVTKLDPNVDHASVDAVEVAVQASLQRLGVNHIDVLMLHREELLDGFKHDVFAGLIKKGRILSLGVSVYTPERALQALATQGIDCVQIPTSIVDRRFAKAGVFEKAQAAHKTIFVRSVFLQGLLLMRPDALPTPMAFAQDMLNRLKEVAGRFDISIETLCLGYVRAKWPQCRVIVGAESVIQVETNARIQPLSAEILQVAEQAFNDVDQKILNPMHWPKWR